jgi:malonyl CoA-acyl carrier protein transacylase
VAFLYTGQGSQYVNMLQSNWPRRKNRIVKAGLRTRPTAVMTPAARASRSRSYIFVDGQDPAAVAQLAKCSLRQTEITQPALLAADSAIHASCFGGLRHAPRHGHGPQPR